MTTAKDWRGTTIKVGSKVIYPGRQGSRQWITEGVVASVKDGKVGVRRVRSTTGKHSGQERVAYPDVGRITVIG